jgi:membrane protease YdiL (CAAX protease family)
MTLRRTVTIVIITELIFVLATRLVVHRYPWTSFEAEAIRTLLRIVTATIYWWQFKPLILSRTAHLSTLRSPWFIAGLLFFMSIPIIIGQYHLTHSMAIMFAVTSTPVALKEEFLFRGIVQNLLLEKFGLAKSVLLTSVIFTAWHIGVWGPSLWVFSQIFLASVLLGVIYVYSGSILLVIAIHAAYDALFSFTPLLAIPFNENYGFIPMLTSLALVGYWASCRMRSIIL